MQSIIDQLVCYGVSFKTTSIEHLNHWVVSPDQVESRLLAIQSATGMPELMAISTCNRVEIYGFATHAIPELSTILAAWKPETEIADREWTVRTGLEACRHLMEVASSVDSMVIGETQILKQIKDAHLTAKQAGIAGKYMNLLVRAVIETSKRVYTETRLTENPVSVASMTYRFVLNGVPDQSMLVFIGAGDVVQSMVPYFSKMGKFHFLFVNRTRSRAEELVSRYGGKALSLDEFLVAPPDFSALISSTRSTGWILTRQWLESRLGHGAGSRRLFIDLANPPDIEPAIADLPGVQLINLQQVEHLAAENNRSRQQELEQVMGILDEETNRILTTFRDREVDELLGFLPVHAAEIKHKAVEKILRTRLKHLSADDHAIIREFADYLSEKIVQVPYTRARQSSEST